jgi:hypothetical protein
VNYIEGEANSIQNEQWGKTAVNDSTNAGTTGNESTGQLLKLYKEFADIIESKKIAHEWIWEKL